MDGVQECYHRFKQMASLLTNLTVIQQLARDLVRGKQLNYSQQCIPYYVEEAAFTLENIDGLRNISGHLLKASLIKHKDPSSPPTCQPPPNNTVQWAQNSIDFDNKAVKNQKCIIFLHGLGSSRLEAMPLVEMLPPEYCLFAFDLCGSGKSQGDNITYGLRQAEDIEAILDYLKKNKGIKEFVIWGRSMGAVASILFSAELYKKAQESVTASSMHSRIKGLIIDSPFGDFQEITKQIALKRVAVPQFLVQFALKFVNQSFEHLLKDQTRGGKVYNPFSINLASGPDIETGVPTVFLYSLADEVVEKAHSEAIINKYKSRYEKIIMEEVTHNQTRPEAYVSRVFQLLTKFNQKRCREKRRSSVGNIHQRGLARTSSTNLDTEDGPGRRRGISVSSKQKLRRGHHAVPTEESFQELNLKKTRIQEYNSHKIEPKKNFILPSSSSDISPRLKEHEKRPCSPLRLKLSNSVNKHKEEAAKPSRLMFQHPHPPLLSQQQTFYNTISYDNTDLLHKKLYRNEPNERAKPMAAMETKVGGNRGRRQNQAMRKLEYQLNHTRYL